MSTNDVLLPNKGTILNDVVIPNLVYNDNNDLIASFNIQPACKATRLKKHKFRANFVIAYNIPRITKDPQVFVASNRPTVTYNFPLPANHKKPIHYLSDFFHVQKKDGEKQLHLISKRIVFDCDEWQKSNLLSRIDLIKQTQQGEVEYIFKSMSNADFEYQLLKNNNGQLEEVKTLDDAIIAFRLLHSVWLIIRSMYQKKTKMEQKLYDYLKGFIKNKHWAHLHTAPIRSAYFYFIETQITVKYKDLNVHPNKLFQLMLDEYWRVHDQDYLYQYASEQQRDGIPEIVKQIQEVREKVDYFLSINDTRSARNQLLHGYQFTPAVNKLLINIPYLFSKKQLHLIWQVFNMIGADRLVALIDHLIMNNFYYLSTLSALKTGRGSGDFYIGLSSDLETEITSLMHICLLGFSFNQINNALQAYSATYFEECLAMYRNELAFNPNYQITHRHIRQWHDEMVAANERRQLLRKIQEDEQKKELYNKPHVSKFTKELCRGYVFKPIDNANDLFFIGDKLKNCIGWAGYIDAVISKGIDIITIYHNETLIAVMDININPQLVSPIINQAKMYNNTPAREETSLLDAIIAWSINNKVRYDASKDLL